LITEADTDPLAARIWTEAIDLLASALATYSLLLAPDLIVIGGGLGAAGDRLFEPLRVALAARLLWVPTPPLRPAVLGDQAGCLGAAILAWRAAGVQPDWKAHA